MTLLAISVAVLWIAFVFLALWHIRLAKCINDLRRVVLDEDQK